MSRASAAFAVAASMLVYWTGCSEVHGIAKLVAVSAAICAGWAALARSDSSRPRTPLDGPLLALFAAFAASLLFSPDRWVGIVGVYGLYNHGLLAFFSAASVFLIVAASPAGEAPSRWICAAGVAAGTAAVLQAAGSGAFVPPGRSLPYGRAIGLMGDPVFLGASLIAVLPAGAALARSSTGKWRVVAVASAVCAAGGIAASGSRGAMAGGFAAVATWFLLDRRARGLSAPRPRWVALGLAACVFAGAAFTVLRAASDSDVGRVEVWKTGLSVFRASPVFGAGMDRFQTEMRRRRSPELIRILGSRGSQVSAHNDWIQILATAGLLGGLAWLWLHWGLLSLLGAAWSDEKSRGAACAAAGVFAGLFVQAKVNPLPLACFLQAAAFAGGLAAFQTRPSFRGFRILAVAGSAVAAGAVVLSLRLGAADAALLRARQSLRAGRVENALAEFSSASKRNPYEMFYRVHESRALYSAAQSTEGSKRRELLSRAFAVGDDAVRYRPTETEGHLIRATYRLALKADGGDADLDLAAESVDAALAVDPFFIPALENGAQIAALRGERGRAEELSARARTVRDWLGAR